MKIAAFTSDTHYGHKSILEYSNRPFISIWQMETELIERYNSKVGPSDTVLWVGDCFFCNKSDAKKIMDRLNGTKIVVLGNHDRNPGPMTDIGFTIAMTECVINIAGQAVRVSHYPYQDKRYPDRCPKKSKDEMLIHGHTHSTKRIDGKQIHVGVDAWDYYPAMYNEVEKLVVG